MKAKDFVRRIFLTEYVDKGGSVDRIITDNGDREVERVATCMVITPDVLRKAVEWGAHLIVTHEPTYHKDVEEFFEYKPYITKRDILKEHNIAVCRWHDSPHYGDVDDVSASLVNRMSWKGRFDGKFIFEFDEPLSPLQIARDIRDNMGIAHPRIVGSRDGLVRKVSIQLGQRAVNAYLDMLHNDVDLLISGETCEWYCCEPIRDMSQVGMQKSIIIIGHAGSERLAMEDLANKINRELSEECGVVAKYFDCGELYSYID